MNSSNDGSYKKKGSQLPQQLRPYAKSAYLIRDKEGIHLYDDQWMYITSLKLAPKILTTTQTHSGTAESRKFGMVTRNEPSPPERELTGFELTTQVQLILDRFQHAVTLHGIRSDYFFEHRLGYNWQDRWERIWKGDLSPLLEDTQEFLPGQDVTTRVLGGLGVLKAALIHELYVNSTLAGRSQGEKERESGRNMLNLLLFVCQLNCQGELDDVGDLLSENDQENLINLLLEKGTLFEDKKWMLQRVHQKLVFDFKRGRAWPEKPTVAAVKSALIFKLYENTNRLDRGNGSDMVMIVRELLAAQLI